MGRKIKVILQPVKFRKKDHIAILNPSNSEVDAIVRSFENAEWSTGYRFWHLPYTSDILKSLKNKLKAVTNVDSSSFKDFEPSDKKVVKVRRKRVKTEKPSEKQQINIAEFCSDLSVKGYSQGTLKVYKCMLNVFFGWFKNKEEEEITLEDVNQFIKEYIEQNNFTTSYKRLMKNSLRNYFEFKGLSEHSAIKNI